MRHAANLFLRQPISFKNVPGGIAEARSRHCPAITAQFNAKKTGTAGGYSYVGVYGWSINPCVEFYIVDDSYNRMPVNPGNTQNQGTASIDGGSQLL